MLLMMMMGVMEGLVVVVVVVERVEKMTGCIVGIRRREVFINVEAFRGASSRS